MHVSCHDDQSIWEIRVQLKELWRDAADFDTLEGDHRMGIKLTRDSASSGNISVYFGPGVTREEQVIFANYIHAHLKDHSDQVQRLQYYVCPKCHTPKGNAKVLMDKLLVKKQIMLRKLHVQKQMLLRFLHVQKQMPI